MVKRVRSFGCDIGVPREVSAIIEQAHATEHLILPFSPGWRGKQKPPSWSSRHRYVERTQPLPSFPVPVALGTFTFARRLELDFARPQARNFVNARRMIGANFCEVGVEAADHTQVAFLNSGERVGLSLERIRKGANLFLQARRSRTKLRSFGS